MVLSKPQDLAVIAALFALLMIMVSFGVQDLTDRGATVNNTFFSSVRESSQTSQGFKGAADSSILTVAGVNGTSDETTESSILTQGFTGLVNLGQTWGILWNELITTTELIGIPAEYIVILAGLLAISFVVVLYTWIRARS